MWLAFDGGFVSIVQKRESRGFLCVRARARGDLGRFVELGRQPATIQETPDADYRFRVVLPEKVVSFAMRRIVDGIDYDNFKDRVRQSQGEDRAHIYGEVWATLREIQHAELRSSNPARSRCGSIGSRRSCRRSMLMTSTLTSSSSSSPTMTA